MRRTTDNDGARRTVAGASKRPYAAPRLVRYGDVMKIIDVAAGLNLRISLVTEGMIAAARQK